MSRSKAEHWKAAVSAPNKEPLPPSEAFEEMAPFQRTSNLESRTMAKKTMAKYGLENLNAVHA